MTSSEQQPGEVGGSGSQDVGPDVVAQDAGQDASQDGGTAGGTAGGEPAKKHGDPLFNEAEGEHGPADVPEVGEGTATSASAG